MVEFDIKGLFDNIDHELLLRAVRKHCGDPWVLVYIERWLKAPMEVEGRQVARERGAPQGGVVSPLLANLFLHDALEVWLRRHLRSVRFCRYADDDVIHCQSEAQAQLVLRKLGERLGQCGLELHPEKTRIVYCQDVNRKAAYPVVQFTFLGYTFRPRKAVDKYGRFYASAMKPPWRSVNDYLVRWRQRKFKRLARGVIRASRALGRLAERVPRSFVHWEMGFIPAAR